MKHFLYVSLFCTNMLKALKLRATLALMYFMVFIVAPSPLRRQHDDVRRF